MGVTKEQTNPNSRLNLRRNELGRLRVLLGMKQVEITDRLLLEENGHYGERYEFRDIGLITLGRISEIAMILGVEDNLLELVRERINDAIQSVCRNAQD